MGTGLYLFDFLSRLALVVCYKIASKGARDIKPGLASLSLMTSILVLVL